MNTKYENMFLKSDRLSSKTGKTAKIVDPIHFTAFLEAVKNDEELPLWLKATIACGLCLGGRVSEVLSIKKNQIDSEGNVQGLKVLKKRRDGILRDGKLHPVALRIVQEYAKVRRPHEFLFRGVTRQRVHRWVQKVFGSDPHALFRHSFVSFLVHKGQEGLVIARLLNLSSVSVAYGYTHISAQRVMDSIYSDAA